MPGRNTLRLLAVLALVLLLSGCGSKWFMETLHLDTLVTFFTAGPVAAYQRNLMLFTFTVMLFVLVPVVGFTLWFAWNYRASNRSTTYTPNWHHSSFLEVFLWGGPVVIILVLALLTWVTTYDLDPYKSLESENEPITVQAIAMDWKWLFIYPEQNVAVVNELAMPVDVPIRINMTSATVLNAFMIPRLGSQMMAMSGMGTQLNLMASEKGVYFGKNYQYSGDGFADMHFEAHAVTQSGFDQWVAKARASGRPLNDSAYEELVKPSRKNDVGYYSSVRDGLYQNVIQGTQNSDARTGHADTTASAKH